MSRSVPLPTEAEALKLVDTLITPEDADREAHALIAILSSTANFENDEQGNLAQAMISRAYRKTEHYHRLVESGLNDFMQHNLYVKTEKDETHLEMIG